MYQISLNGGSVKGMKSYLFKDSDDICKLLHELEPGVFISLVEVCFSSVEDVLSDLSK